LLGYIKVIIVVLSSHIGDTSYPCLMS